MHAGGETKPSVSEIESYAVQRGTSRTVIDEFSYDHSTMNNSSIKFFLPVLLSVILFDGLCQAFLSPCPMSMMQS